MTEWRVFIDGTEEERLIDLSFKDAYNRFARVANLDILDPEGNRVQQYVRNRTVELEYREDKNDTWKKRFGGFVSEKKTDEDTLQVEVLSHDFWLKKAPTVFATYTDETVESILNDLIDRLTPLKFPAANLNLVNNPTITRTWKGENLTKVLEELNAIAGGDHEFGGNDDREFFFKQTTLTSSGVTFNNTTSFNISFDDDPKRDVNDVTIFYGEGANAKAVRVQDREQQKQLADELGSNDPVKISLTKNYPDITTQEAARNKAQALINNRISILSGTIETWKRVGIEPGELTQVEAEDQDQSGGYRVAQIEHTWSKAETIITVAERGNGTEDQLVSLSDEVRRLDLRQVDDDVTRTEFFALNSEVEIKEPRVKVYSRDINDSFVLGSSSNGVLGEDRLGDRRGSKNLLVDSGD